MNQNQTSLGGEQGVPLEDPLQIRQHLEDLRASEAEFPIKVEGTHTLPYTAQIQTLEAGEMHLKLIRPLPHEMAPGAPFEMLFSTAEQRFKAPLSFLGRKSYLLYQFSLPAQLVPSDQRQHKRYPFRPREKTYVMAQDGGVPGYGLAGPLVNLSLGGLAFRVDRVVRLDDHLRVTPGLGFFDKGKALPMIKIRDLPKLPLFEARGAVANACERNGEIVIGVQFGELGTTELTQLREVLEFRERLQRASSSTSSASTHEGQSAGASLESSVSDPSRLNPAGLETPEALSLLGRRCTGMMLAMAPGPIREQIQATLAQGGYLRVDAVDSLQQALALLRADKGGSSPLLLTAMETLREGDLADIRSLQRDLGDLRELPVAILMDSPAPELTDAFIHALPLPGDGDTLAWLREVDEVAGISEI